MNNELQILIDSLTSEIQELESLLKQLKTEVTELKKEKDEEV